MLAHQPMAKQSNQINIIDVTAANVAEQGIYCIKDKKSPGYNAKVEWFKLKLNKGLKIKIATDAQNMQLGFIEFIPSELAWRPVKASNYLFIQCIAVFVKEAKNNSIGSSLLNACEQEAIHMKRAGICAMSSDGPWMANKSLFEKNKFQIADQLDRFELMVKTLDAKNPQPKFIDWTKKQQDYQGWNLVYSDQCPWHEKSITDLSAAALAHGINLNVKKLTTPAEAQQAPSGFGTFSLIEDGKLLGDHYLSKTRFENIIRQEMK